MTRDKNTKSSCGVWLRSATVKFLYMFLFTVTHSEFFKNYIFQAYIIFTWVLFFAEGGICLFVCFFLSQVVFTM